MLKSRRTINIHTGKKLSSKSRDEIMEAIFQIYGDKFEIIAVQQNYQVIRVTFVTEAAAMDALKEKGARLFGIWCRVDGGPPVTIIHSFEFPHQEGDDLITQLFAPCTKAPTGTRLIDIREFKQIATAGATTAAVTEKVWGEYVAAVCQILAK